MDVIYRDDLTAYLNLTVKETGPHRKLKITCPEDCALHCEQEPKCRHMEFEGLLGNGECRLFYEN